MILRKDIYGSWCATSDFELSNGFTTRITTRKLSSGPLCTRVTCHKLEGKFEVHRMFTDFSLALRQTNKRCTEKAVKEMHKLALADVEALKVAAENHYAV